MTSYLRKNIDTIESCGSQRTMSLTILVEKPLLPRKNSVFIYNTFIYKKVFFPTKKFVIFLKAFNIFFFSHDMLHNGVNLENEVAV